jgi:NAD(P)-dependent dehydrogenase (short-subunit alcohol dehydrogenase family)
VQKALPLMPDDASIIVNASIVASKGLQASSVYSATKAAVRSFARTWTTDLKVRGIRVNAISPGFIDTPGLSDLLASSGVGEQRRTQISNAVPLGRFGTPDEVAKAVVFLAVGEKSLVLKRSKIRANSSDISRAFFRMTFLDSSPGAPASQSGVHPKNRLRACAGRSGSSCRSRLADPRFPICGTA